MTRFEKIQKMSVEELAEYLVEHIDCGICNSSGAIETWLEGEADDET